MGRYDFTTRPDRLNQFTYKWKTSENNPELLQMWVADMDFLPVPEIKESDDDLRTRTQLAFEALSSAGPRKAYTFYALSAHGGIADVSVVSPKPACVTVTVQAHDNNGTPTPEMIEAVKNALNDESVRPIADRVTVQAVEVFEYQVNAKLHLFRGPQTEPILKAAKENLQRYTQRTKRIGKDITRSGIYVAYMF